MELFYPLLIAFVFVFISELGDKTQLLVLSFSAKQKTITILLGVAIGSFLSHGVAILFGSALGLAKNEWVGEVLKLITYFSFLVFGIITLIKKNKGEDKIQKKDGKKHILQKIGRLKLNYIAIIAFSIAIGELGDKTFLASMGLGIGYPNAKLFLIIGAILGMVVSDSLAILFGKMLSKKIPEETMQKISGGIFLLFGGIGLIHYFWLI